MPSSLSTILPFACAFSARPPVSVCGTVWSWGTAVFPGSVWILLRAVASSPEWLTVTAPSFTNPDNTERHRFFSTWAFARTRPPTVPPFRNSLRNSCRPFSIGRHHRVESLGLTNPPLFNVLRRKPWAYGGRDLRPYMTLLMPACSPLGPPGSLTLPLPRPPERSATNGV